MQLWKVLDDIVPDRLQQVGFPKASVTDDEQRVVSPSGCLSN